jgi:hypothetical protein
MTAVDNAEETVRAAVPEIAAEVLAGLRWGPDQKIVNYDGEEVWLKQVPRTPELHGYITDCCFAAAPCERHR